ncbi:MAG: LolA family protein [Aquificaceae bacterium]
MMFLVLLFLFCLSFAQSFEDFQKRLDSIRTIKVSFVQRVQYPWQSGVEASKGVFYAQRGGKFRIEYEQPDRTLILSDGVQVMVYSLRDKTAYLDSLERNRSPLIEALFLISKPLSEVFDLVSQMEEEGAKTFILKPKVKDDYFSRVFVEVSHRGDISSIKVEEKGGIITTIEFIRVSTNFTPSEGLFRITLPEGARVIRP